MLFSLRQIRFVPVANKPPSVHASSSALNHSKSNKITKADVIKNQNSPSHESPDQDQIRSSASNTQTHPLDLSLSSQSVKFTQGS